MAGTTSKRNFDFKMSKKVAELTQVVHMLFTRNHEKEVEFEALKVAYEEEIRIVIADAKSKIHELQVRIEDLERQRLKQAEEKELRLQDECQKRESQLQGRIRELEAQLQEEKTESQTSRDLLIRAQKDLQDLRQGHTQEISSMTNLSEEKDREIVRLKKGFANMERKVLDKDSLLDSKGELLRTHEKLRRESDQLRESLKEADQTKEDMISRAKRLEGEVKALRKELAKRGGNERQSAKVKQPLVSHMGEHSDEVEHLRRELLKYKMELCNRESNFNRMFSDRQPVTTDVTSWRSSPLGRGSTQPEALPGGLGMKLTRERTYAGESLSYNNGHTKEIESPRNARSAVGRMNRNGLSFGTDRTLPQLMETNKLNKLAKPRPLPKELLTGRTGAR